jgi:hypothetical protein
MLYRFLTNHRQELIKRCLPLYALLLLLAGCATRISEPMNIGQGVYMMHGSTLGLMTSTHDVVTDVERGASSFCASNGGRALEVVRVDTTAPALFHFPEGRLEFRCVKQAQDVASTSTGSR